MESTTPRYNVLHIIVDQHQAACMGCEGHPQAITPNLDRLAAEGVRFNNAYTQNPICTPSRVSFLSGQYCHNHGYYGLVGPTPHSLPTFLGHFRRNGYRTAGIGKLHVPHDPVNWLVANEDLDLFADCYASANGISGEQYSAYYEYLRGAGLLDTEDSVLLPEFKGKQQMEARPSNMPYEHSVEGWCVRRAIDFMDTSDGRPFCMQVSLPRPHQCYTPSQQFWDMYPGDLPLPDTYHQDASGRPPHFERMATLYRAGKGLIEPTDPISLARRVWRGYLGCVTQVDYAVGELIEHLQKTDRLESTIVVFTADHGSYSSCYGILEKAPGICSELVCRVPFIWRVPGVTRAGHVATQLVENIDMPETIVSLCNLPAMNVTDGCDITPLLRGGDEPVRNVAMTENPWSKALRWDQWRFVHYQPEMFGGQDVGELYNLEDDPNETTNLYHDDAYRHVVEQGRRLLLEQLIRTSRPTTVWPPPNIAEGDRSYPLAADGKEVNTAGVPLRVSQGYLNYL